MNEARNKGTHRYFLSRHHREARDNLLAQIKNLSCEAADRRLVAAYCVALITTATCFIECRINEFWSSILNDGRDNWGLTDEQKKRFKDVAASFDWKMKNTVLEKYQIALAILSLPTFNKGSSPYQDAETLVLLRNEVVHNEPRNTELTDGERLSSQPKLEARLRTRIGECPYDALKSIFPENCLHQGCAEWASETSQNFVDEFLRRTGASTKPFVMSVEFRNERSP